MSNYDFSRRVRMTWQGNLSQMKAAGTLVTRMCSSPCRYIERIDLDAMIALLGPEGDLWDARPPCPLCDGRNHFMCSPGPSTPFRPMLSWDQGPEPERPPEGWPAWP
jgi:hypothetical protein